MGIFWNENQLVLRRTVSVFSKRTAKVRVCYLPANFYVLFCSHLPHIFFSKSSENFSVLFERAAKIRVYQLLTNNFAKKFVAVM